MGVPGWTLVLLYLTGSQRRKQGEERQGKERGERELCDGELTAENQPDLEEKAPSVHGLG